MNKIISKEHFSEKVFKLVIELRAGYSLFKVHEVFLTNVFI